MAVGAGGRSYREIHHFYDQLCPKCAELNWFKRYRYGRAQLTSVRTCKLHHTARPHAAWHTTRGRPALYDGPLARLRPHDYISRTVDRPRIAPVGRSAMRWHRCCDASTIAASDRRCRAFVRRRRPTSARAVVFVGL